MRRVWATLAIIAGLAWSRQPPAQPLAQATPTTLVVKGKHGVQRFVVVVSAKAAAHATTHASPAPPA